MNRTFVSAALLAALLATGCSKITRANYDRLKVGMHYAEVVKILGKPDSCSEMMVARSCRWGNERRNITVNFLGDSVLLFTATGIR